MPTQYGTYSLITGLSETVWSHTQHAQLLISPRSTAPTLPVHLSGTFNLTSPKHLVDEMFDYQRGGVARGASDSSSIPERYLPTTWMGSIVPACVTDYSPRPRRASPGLHEAIGCNNYLAARLALHTSNRKPRLQCQGR